MSSTFQPRSKQSTADLILTVLLAAIVAGALFAAWSLYQTTRSFVATSQLPIFPRADGSEQPLPTPDRMVVASTPLSTATVVLADSENVTPPPNAATGTPPPVVAAPLLEEPLTILLMGIDLRPEESDIPRTDSIILLRIDPATGEVGMLSFPRDLYITIPNYGDGEYLDRINMPYRLGELYDYPGGGPALAKQAIRRNFGIQVDRYLTMDFDGFRRIIDEIGGIEIDVPAEIVDRDYPTENFGTMTVRFAEGRQVMDGERALIYARTRKSTSDFARAERQQQVILAVRDKVLSLDIIPSLTPRRIASLAATVNESIATDLSIDELFALVQTVQSVESRDINRAVIDSTLVREYRTYSGAEVLLPRWNEVLPLVKETFGIELLPIAPTPTPPPPPTPTRVPPTATPEEEGEGDYRGTILLHNASMYDGVETRLQSVLQSEGFNIAGASFAAERNRPDTVILITSEEALGTAYRLAERLGLPADSVRFGQGGTTDVTLIIGNDLGTLLAQ